MFMYFTYIFYIILLLLNTNIVIRINFTIVYVLSNNHFIYQNW